MMQVNDPAADTSPAHPRPQIAGGKAPLARDSRAHEVCRSQRRTHRPVMGHSVFPGEAGGPPCADGQRGDLGR